MADDPTPLQRMPTHELLTWLLRVAEAEPQRAPDDVVELVRRARERLADEEERPQERESKGGYEKEAVMTTIDAWTYRNSVAAGAIVGYDVEALDGEIGEVSEASNDVGASYVVVDTGPWIFGKKVMLPAIAIERVDHREERVWVNRTKDEIKNAPGFDAASYRDDDYRNRLAAYYTGRAAR
jgi:hypothetical protein